MFDFVFSSLGYLYFIYILIVFYLYFTDTFYFQSGCPACYAESVFTNTFGAQGEGERDREVFSWEDNDCNDNDLNFDDNIEIIFPGCCYNSFWASSLTSQGRVQPCG